MDDDARVRMLFEHPNDPQWHAWAGDPDFFDRFLRYTRSVADSRPEAALEPVKAALWRAPTRCQTVRAWGLLAHIRRALGDLSAAALALEAAFIVAGYCEACLADLFRRLAVLLRAQGDFENALEAANDALCRYVTLGRPGHDLHGNGLASTYNVRAGIYFHSGDASAAVLDEREAIVLIDPVVSPSLYGTVLANLADCLRSTGKRSDLLLADEYLKKARRHYQGLQSVTQERAKLDWVTAMVRHRLKSSWPVTVRRILERSLAAFLDLGMPVEAVAVLSDLSRVELERPDYRQRIWNLLSEMKACLSYAELTPDIRDAIDQLKATIRLSEWDGRKNVGAAITRLREACGPDMIACLLT